MVGGGGGRGLPSLIFPSTFAPVKEVPSEKIKDRTKD
jgi:hypothetical protein